MQTVSGETGSIIEAENPSVVMSIGCAYGNVMNIITDTRMRDMVIF